MDDVIEALGINKIDTSGKLMFIDEQHGSDAKFLLHAVTAQYTKNKDMVCLVLFHNTFGHCHNVGMKLGYNLRQTVDSQIHIIEPLKAVSKSIHSLDHDSIDNQDSLFDITKCDNLVQSLIEAIKQKCTAIKSECNPQKLLIVVDDLSHLFDLGLSLDEVWLFVKYLRSLTQIIPCLFLCILCHTNKESSESSINSIANGLSYFAQLVVKAQPLKTGHSKDVSGKIIVSWKDDLIKKKFKCANEAVHLYKLFDRQVKLFAPGSSLLM